MSLTHPNPFQWKSNPPMPELADFLREMSGKTPPKPLKAGVVHQPPAFRKPKAKPVKEARQPQAPGPMPVPKRAVRTTSITGQLRLLLEQLGPMTRAEIADRAGLDSQKVGELLKQCRHVRLDESKYPQRYYVASNPPAGVTL